MCVDDRHTEIGLRFGGRHRPVHRLSGRVVAARQRLFAGPHRTVRRGQAVRRHQEQRPLLLRRRKSGQFVYNG